MKGLTDVRGIRVGHASDFEAITGCTVILFDNGAVAGADVRGSATGTSEFLLLDPLNMTERINAVTFSGGSAFGLETAAGVRRYLEQKGVGYVTPHARVPLVPCAILYDLGIGKSGVRPGREMGQAAAAAASDSAVQEGCVGAGTGATVGKIFGMKQAMKSGIGSFTVRLDSGVLVSALVVVNAFGDVIDPRSGAVIAGARKALDSHEFVNTAQEMLRTGGRGPVFSHTTLALVVTDAALTKTAAKKLAELASIGVAKTISPVWTTVDGDVMIAASAGGKQADINVLGVAAAEAVSQAILRAVRLARGMGGIPGLAG